MSTGRIAEKRSKRGVRVRSASTLGSRHREETPRPVDSFELVVTGVRKGDARAGHQVHDRPRHQHLAGAGAGLDSLRQVHRYAADVVTSNLNLASMDPEADLQSEPAEAVA